MKGFPSLNTFLCKNLQTIELQTRLPWYCSCWKSVCGDAPGSSLGQWNRLRQKIGQEGLSFWGYMYPLWKVCLESLCRLWESLWKLRKMVNLEHLLYWRISSSLLVEPAPSFLPEIKSDRCIPIFLPSLCGRWTKLRNEKAAKCCRPNCGLLAFFRESAIFNQRRVQPFTCPAEYEGGATH